MTNFPWLNPETIKLVHLLLNSHQKAFGYPLFVNSSEKKSELINNEKLFSLGIVVMAHDTAKDPILNYSNALALHIWERTWSEMIGMPSRLTAPSEERSKRARAMENALLKNSISNYQGIRISSTGKRFLIRKARVWKIWDEHNNAYGQAAAFSHWQWI